MTNEDTLTISEELKAKRKIIENRIISLEKYNYNQKDYSQNEMVDKIKKIIEEEINK